MEGRRTAAEYYGSTPTAVDFPVNAMNPSLMLDLDQVKQALDDPSIALLDVRDIDEWIG